MKKRALLLAAVAAVVPFSGALAGPAPQEGSFSAQLAPFPKLAAWGDPAGLTEPGCLAGEKDVHWAAEEFTATAKGTLVAETSGFTGDYDLYLLDGDGMAMAVSDAAQIQDQAPAEESVTLAMKPKQTVSITVCNWLGAPDVTVDWTFTPGKTR